MEKKFNLNDTMMAMDDEKWPNNGHKRKIGNFDLLSFKGERHGLSCTRLPRLNWEGFIMRSTSSITRNCSGLPAIESPEAPSSETVDSAL